MEQVLQLVVVFIAALATGGLMVNWIALGRATSHLSERTTVLPEVTFVRAVSAPFIQSAIGRRPATLDPKAVARAVPIAPALLRCLASEPASN